MRIDDYLNQHMIIRISNSPLREMIVDNPKEFVPVVRENGYYISEILWWERADLVLGTRIGHGGSRDPRSPNSHFFAETDLYKVFDTILQDEEYYAYFDQIKNEYPDLDLTPGFDIKQLPQV